MNMISIDEQPNNNTLIFLKEYTKLYYTDFQSVKSEVNIRFGHPSSHYDLPPIYIDTMRDSPRTYLLRCNHHHLNKQLFIRDIQQHQWIKIVMNDWPENLAITDGHAFVFGGKEVFVVGLESSLVKLVGVEEAKKVDLKLCFTSSKQAGVFVVYFNHKVGYFIKEYSKSSQVTFWNKLHAALPSFTLKTSQQYDFFQTIFPNLIAIAIKHNTMIVYDLNKVQPTGLTVTVQCAGEAITSMKWMVRQSNKGFQQALYIFVLIKNIIRCYVLHIGRVQVTDALEANVSIESIARGNVIDWANSILEKDQFQITYQQQITHFQLTPHQIIVRANHPHLYIPTISISTLQPHLNPNPNPNPNPSPNYKIICQESSIWYQYFKHPTDTRYFQAHFNGGMQQNQSDGWKEEKAGKNALRVGNDCLYSVNKWRQNNKFHSFFIINNCFHIARTHSITVFQKITSLQYSLQAYSDSDRLRDEELKLANLLKPKSLSVLKESLIIKEYSNILRETKGYAELAYNLHKQSKDNGKQLPSKSRLLLSTLIDKIDYWNEVVRFVHSDLQFQETSYKNNQITRVIEYLHKCLFDDKAGLLKGSFIELFIQKNEHELSEDNEINTIIFFKKLLRNILPECFMAAQTPRNSLTSNEYLQFLISFVLVSKHEGIAFSVEKQLKKLFSTVFPDMIDKTQPNIINNISFIRAYFLSHPQQPQLSSFTHQIVSSTNYRHIIDNLKQMFHLISNQMDALIKAELSLKKNLLSSQIFPTCINQQLNPIIPQKGLLQFAQQTLLSQCNLHSHNLKREQDLGNIRLLLNDLSNQNLALCREAEDKLFKIYRERLSIDILHRNFRQVLQMEQILLQGLTETFSHYLKMVCQNPSDNLDRVHLMERILNQMDTSLLNYKKYFKKLYQFQKKEEIGGTNLIEASKRINYEQGLMSSDFMQAPIQIQNHYICSPFISLLRIILSSHTLLTLSCRNGMDFLSDEYVDEILKQMLGSITYINNQEMDILYYLLMKKGIKYFNRFLNKVQTSAPQKIIKFFTIAQPTDILYQTSLQIIAKHPTTNAPPTPHPHDHPNISF